jgi:hypothetical protein
MMRLSNAKVLTRILTLLQRRKLALSRHLFEPHTMSALGRLLTVRFQARGIG